MKVVISDDGCSALMCAMNEGTPEENDSSIWPPSQAGLETFNLEGGKSDGFREQINFILSVLIDNGNNQ